MDRLERWLRDQGFWYWWTRNDIEPLGVASGPDLEDVDEPDSGLFAGGTLTEAPAMPLDPWTRSES